MIMDSSCRAAFLDDLPDDEALSPLVAAFSKGNYAELRRLEEELQRSSGDPEVLNAAKELVERTEPAREAKALLLISVVFFVFLVGWIYLHHAR